MTRFSHGHSLLHFSKIKVDKLNACFYSQLMVAAAAEPVNTLGNILFAAYL